MLELMILKLVERKNREAEAMNPRASSITIPEDQFFRMAGIEHRKEK
jgi:hypothetical protein